MKNYVSKYRIFILLFSFGLTWYLLEWTSSVTAVSIRQPLSTFPKQIGGFTLSNSFQSSADVLELLGVNDYIQYNYKENDGGLVNFYVGYYRAVGVEGSYHSPKNCIPGGGWGINSVNAVRLNQGIEGANKAVVSEMLIRNGDEYQVVLYWFQNRGRIIASEYWEKIYLVLDALLTGRRDGSFIRIMSYAENGDVEAARERVRAFAQLVLPELENHLPGKMI